MTLDIDGDGVEATDEAVAEEMADGPETSVEDMVCIAEVGSKRKGGEKKKKRKSKECRGVVVKETREVTIRPTSESLEAASSARDEEMTGGRWSK